jgi:hypothetical protein
MACHSLPLYGQHFHAFPLLSIVREQSLIICKLRGGGGDLLCGVGQRLEGSPYRLRSGRFRFRYDIAEREVVLLYCGLRREDTY